MTFDASRLTPGVDGPGGVWYAIRMSATLERLRRLQALRPQQNSSARDPLPATEVAAPESVATQPRAGTLEALIPGTVVENAAGICYVRTQSYALQTERGGRPLHALLNQPPALFAPLHPNFGLQAVENYANAVFLDTETTGLGGGAGVYCFMVGVGTFETHSGGTSPSHFVVRQFFMRNPHEEGALLLALADLFDQHELSVTFNGRTFDLPLLRTRLSQNRHIYPDLRGSGRFLATERPHLDLLPPARRLWRRRLQSCRLINLEQQILGLSRSEADLPGHLIPQVYTDYLRNGDAGEISRVFYHNLEDILSMVALADRLSLAFASSEDASIEREDWLALGVCWEEQERWREAESAYHRALDLVREPTTQREAFARLGQLLKRQQRWGEAAELWERWLTTIPGVDPTPFVELAKYYEWQQVDLGQAEMWTQWALHTLRSAAAWQRPAGAIAELEHRLARLQRKQAGHVVDEAPG